MKVNQKPNQPVPVKAFIDQLALELAATVSVANVISVVAADPLPAFSVSTILGNRADATNNAHYGKVAGIAQTTIASGFAGNIVVEGLLTNGAWSWTPGQPVYLNGTSLSGTAPTTKFSQEIGIAYSSDTIYVDVSVPILL